MAQNESIDLKNVSDIQSIDDRNEELKVRDQINTEIKVEPISDDKNIIISADSCLPTELETMDVFSYTRRPEFTSETHKIEIKNLPKHIGYDTFKKLFKKLDLKPLKTKLIGKPGAPTHSFVTFRCDEDRDQAIDKLNEYLWKNKKLIVRKANPTPDPLVQKRNQLKSDENLETKRLKSEEKHLTEEELSDALNKKVCSLWKMPYNQQKELKYNIIKEFLGYLHKAIDKNIKSSDEYSPEDSQELTKCHLEDIRVSPVVDGYRNKCEFTVGIDKVVGFRLGLYREGTIKVITPALNCPIIGEKMRNILNAFQAYITTESELSAFDPETNCGHWMQCTARTTSNDSMIIMRLHPQQLSKQSSEDWDSWDSLNAEKNKIIKFFEKNSEFGVNSVYIHISPKRVDNSERNLEHLFGQKHIFETIEMERSLKFRISPMSFFQINTIGAQICFESIADLIKPNPELILLDICCGTGTIGLCLASKVKKVIGIELHPDSISDAKFNAESNGISNVQFIEGKAEEKINEALDSCGCDSEIVAVVDPPRAGLNNSIIRVLRSNSLIKRLVYVSCDPQKAIKNLIDLCRPTSKTYRGQPFLPIRAIPIDLFPHTDRCELVLLFERTND